MSVAPHILFAGGGAASHFYPGFAVADHLRRMMPAVQITFAGGGSARERRLVRDAGHHYTMIPTHPRPSNPLQAIRYVTDNAAGYLAARWMLREQRIELVVGLAGSTTMSAAHAAIARGIPLVLMEQDAAPSRSTRWLARYAAAVCVGFPTTAPQITSAGPVLLTGNPVRSQFESLHRRMAPSRVAVGAVANSGLDAAAPRRQRRLVVLGGAGGARSLNESMPGALAKLGDRTAGWQVIHQSGDGQLLETEARYAKLGQRALVVANLDDVAEILFASDVVVCRSSGALLAELAIAGLPALLVPFPQAVDQHQFANAKEFAAAGAARMIDERDCPGGLEAALVKDLQPLLGDHHLRAEMRRQMLLLARPQAAAEVAGAIVDQLAGRATHARAA